MSLQVVVCSHCGTRVGITSETVCPSCRQRITAPEGLTKSAVGASADSEIVRTGETAKVEPNAGYGHWGDEEGEVSREVAIDRRLTGIGGWLILPAIGLVLGAILYPIDLIVSLAAFSVTDTRYPGMFAIGILVEVGLFVFLLVAACRFFGKKSSAPSTIIGFMIASIAASVLLCAMALTVGAEASVWKAVRDLAPSTLIAIIWIKYFRVSRRVKVTFVN